MLRCIMTTLAHEASTVQFSLIRYATKAGWGPITPEEALSRRRGEGGLFFYQEVESAISRFNPFLPPDEVGAVIQRMEGVPNTMVGNHELLKWLRGEQTIHVGAEKRHRNVRLVDYEHPDRNQFQVTWEWAYRNAAKGNRADVMFVLNGVPLAIVENKNPKDAKAMEKALKQLRRYELDTPELLTTPQVFNITHLIEYFYGVTWNYGRKFVFNWRDEQPGNYEDRIKTFFEPARFLRMLKNWILFYVKDDELQKTILRQHQTRAAVKIVARCADPAKRSGLIWHTQGSGKTFTLITGARLILEDTQHFAGATVLLIVDRNELEGQLSGWVERMLGEMKNRGISVEYAISKARLQELFDANFRGLIVSMIHKFDGIRKDSCTRTNVLALIDEAHRSTGGDLGNYLMGALPNATLIGFTGTPVDRTAYGQGTFKTFGREDEKGYLDKYSIAESIADHTTVKLRHTLAPTQIRLPTELLESEFLSLAEAEGVSDIETLNRILERAVNLRTFLKADDRVNAVAEFVAGHFRDNVQPLGYKAFLVAVDREACALYKEELDRHLPPEWSVPVYTQSSADAIDYPLVAKQQLNEAEETSARKLFTKAGQNPQILIVTDKLLTGYDAPILYCMYLDKPMRDHVLLQAIARVNRPYEDESGREKPCGLIVDFVGVLRDLNKALAFDSKDVSGVIEDLDLLLTRFRELMAGPARPYLEKGSGTRDKQLEHLLYETFLEKEKRDAFSDLYHEIEALYEILSPSPELRDYIEDYRRLADLYFMLRNAYGRKTSFYEDVAYKTELLIREEAATYGPVAIGRVVDFDDAALKAIQSKPGPDGAKVLNLAKALQGAAEQHGAEQPYLVGIAERADAVLEAMDERRLSTEKALAELEVLMRERLESDAERAKLGFDVAEYTVFRALRDHGLQNAAALARTIAGAFRRFPNHRDHEDERRQLKAELYKLLIPTIAGKKMIEVAETLLRLVLT